LILLAHKFKVGTAIMPIEASIKIIGDSKTFLISCLKTLPHYFLHLLLIFRYQWPKAAFAQKIDALIALHDRKGMFFSVLKISSTLQAK
jgi:hypothetical protein